ncbi:hypothetical protein QBC46DRAFT_63063 [Diplogelasinospora grovesii]|uniref:MICOS complex subunit MIC12 n=1 Tax=Diplogelasinospora grovesii TaxID=303347 RepID=A0AAN6S9Y9_9PEZI|nr:hypothetical protein QBC46DRAFT_63063 [Diplogelasinospora grovesii]
MGFTTGFTGGVTLTLGLTYLALLTHQRNRQQQADILRSQSHVFNALSRPPGSKPSPGDAPLSRAEQALQERHHHLVETAKDKWNSEIESAVRWAQTKDWSAVREDVENGIANLLGFPSTSAAATTAAAASQSISQSTNTISTKTAALTTQDTVATSQIAARQVKEKNVRTNLPVLLKDQAVETATTIKDDTKAIASAAAQQVERGVEKTKEIVNTATEQVAVKADSVQTKVKRVKKVKKQQQQQQQQQQSEVQKALAQRYNQKSREDVMKKSVEEVLAERYKPIDKRDSTQLRGL